MKARLDQTDLAETLRQQNAMLSETKSALDQRLSSSEDVISDLRKEIEINEVQVIAARNQVKLLESERKEMEQREVSRLDALRKNLNGEADKLRQEQKARYENALLQANKMRLQLETQLRGSVEKTRPLETQVDSLLVQVREKDQEIAQLKEANAISREKIRQLSPRQGLGQDASENHSQTDIPFRIHGGLDMDTVNKTRKQETLDARSSLQSLVPGLDTQFDALSLPTIASLNEKSQRPSSSMLSDTTPSTPEHLRSLEDQKSRNSEADIPAVLRTPSPPAPYGGGEEPLSNTSRSDGLRSQNESVPKTLARPNTGSKVARSGTPITMQVARTPGSSMNVDGIIRSSGNHGESGSSLKRRAAVASGESPDEPAKRLKPFQRSQLEDSGSMAHVNKSESQSQYFDYKKMELHTQSTDRVKDSDEQRLVDPMLKIPVLKIKSSQPQRSQLQTPEPIPAAARSRMRSSGGHSESASTRTSSRQKKDKSRYDLRFSQELRGK